LAGEPDPAWACAVSRSRIVADLPEPIFSR
jgi:hypothetical protein